MRMRLTVIYEYNIPDDLTRRQGIYGATDPLECARIDESADNIHELAALSDLMSYSVKPC